MAAPLRVTRQGALRELATAAKHASKARDRTRYVAVRDVAAGDTIPNVARQHGVGERTLRSWVASYNRDGVEPLADHRTRGRAPALSPSQVKKLAAKLGPKIGTLRGEDLRLIIARMFDVHLSLSGVYYLMRHKLGVRAGRRSATQLVKPTPGALAARATGPRRAKQAPRASRRVAAELAPAKARTRQRTTLPSVSPASSRQRS
ncbi:MAG: helix-turn-helix domain-containing protein [Planctomycetota bacterium]|nr:helix-turn-helix domain-containing protein [Planctomycetota bacterium]